MLACRDGICPWSRQGRPFESRHYPGLTACRGANEDIEGHLNPKLKIGLVAALVLCALGLWWGYSAEQARLLKEATATGATSARAIMYLGGLVATIIALALFVGYEVAHFFGERAERTFVESETEPDVPPPVLEEAEKIRKDGEPLDAIRILREYLQEHPTELRAMSRIAEIYNYDLKNHLAAALEYEELLKRKLPAEEWAWSALHLAKLYGRLNQQEKSIALLEKIDKEYGKTAAAGRARRALKGTTTADEIAQLEAEAEREEQGPQEESA